jgi:uncharacterized protein (DUF1499 family)
MEPQHAKGRWADRLTNLAVFLCFGSVAAGLIGAVGSAQGAWHFRTGFKFLEYGLYAGVAGIVIALVAAFLCWRSGKPSRLVLNLVALLAAGAFVGFLGNQIRIARSVPALHDISTDLEDPPAFERLQLRADNLETIPDLGRPELEAMPPLERWKAVHREAYGDVATIRVPWTVAETIERAQDLAETRGWDIAVADPASGRLEATETSFFFRFKDDVVLRVRPAGQGSGSIVDMRSVSRVGVSDVGVNARRVRDFLADLRRAP